MKTNIGMNIHPYIQVTCHPHVLYPQWLNNTWNIYIRNFQQQPPTSHFTEPEKMAACIKLESAASGSWTRAAGVRGECVTTRPPAPIKCDMHDANSLVPQFGYIILYIYRYRQWRCGMQPRQEQKRPQAWCWNCSWARAARNFREVEAHY